MNLNIIEDSEKGLDDAKTNLRQAAHRIDPLLPMRKHPFTTIAVAGISGYLVGSKDHPALMKTLRLSLSVANFLKPVLLTAGKFAAAKMAASAAESATADTATPPTEAN